MTGATIPRPDPVPTCVSQLCPETAVGVDCDGPACAKHMCGEPLCNKRSLYAPAAPAPVAIGVVSEATRMLAILDAADSHGVRVELLALSLERAYQTGRADALLAREGK